MRELPPDPPRLRAILTHLERQVADADTITTYLRLQRHAVQQALAQAERPQRRQPKGQPATRVRPPEPDWYLDRGAGRTQPPIAVHARGCWALGSKAEGVSLDTARQALAAGVEACTACRPDTELGIDLA
ncbi:DUF6233 domain-containing protein [Streptomyces sp. NPDC020800]|uniref:DUF6233 domain-containing protein n=1 Tax=Streptomyces sp. NPDC020800 TaxID=3365092 RepID=UPI0037BD7FBA